VAQTGVQDCAILAVFAIAIFAVVVHILSRQFFVAEAWGNLVAKANRQRIKVDWPAAIGF